MNLLPQDKLDAVLFGVHRNMSIREIVKYTGVAKNTVMKIKQGNAPVRPEVSISGTKGVAEERYYEALANRNPPDENGNPTCVEHHSLSLVRSRRFIALGVLEKEKPKGLTPAARCGNVRCYAPEHVYLRPLAVFKESPWKDIARRIEALPIDGEFDLPDFPRESEAERTKLRCNVMVHTMARFAIRSQPTGGIKIIRVGTYGSLYRGIQEEYTETVHPVVMPPWLPIVDGDCLLAPTKHTAHVCRWKAAEAGIENPESRRLSQSTPAPSCGNLLCFSAAHLYMRPKIRRGPGKPPNDIGQGFYLGLLWGTSKAEIPYIEMPHCAIRGCAFPAHGDMSLCHTHQHYFDVEGFEGVIDVNDMFADDNGGDATFTVGMLWEDRYNWLNVRKEGMGGKDARERQNDDWWHENVVKAGLEVNGVITPKIPGSVLADVLKNRGAKGTTETLKPGVGAHTSLHGKMRNHSKKKIRKVQRNRPAGWHGSHGDHDPIYFTRDTLRGIEYDDVAFAHLNRIEEVLEGDNNDEEME